MRTTENFYYSGFKGVDFDGTLVKEDVIGYNVPVMPMVERVKQWLADGEEVVIFTARGWQKSVEDFCIKYFGRPLPVTNVKMRGMAEWYDDRAICVERDTGRILDPVALAKENALLKRKVGYLLGRCKQAGVEIRTTKGEKV